MPILGIVASAKTGNLWPANSYESIATVTGSGQTTISFTSIPSTYTSLQLRIATTSSRYNSLTMYFNNLPTTGNFYQSGFYRRENATQGAYNITNQDIYYLMYAANTPLTFPWVGIVDIFNYSTTYKTSMKVLGGGNNNTTTGFNGVEINSGLWNDTSVISSISISGITFATGCSVALYGVK